MLLSVLYLYRKKLNIPSKVLFPNAESEFDVASRDCLYHCGQSLIEKTRNARGIQHYCFAAMTFDFLKQDNDL
jgi:hypothetical protein